MPYRRLPNTDQARVRALRTALEESDRQHLQLVIAYKTQHEAKMLLQKFEQAMELYKQTYDNQVRSNKDFQVVFRNARLYISHFIQVLNLSVQRDEIKKEYKKFYHLDPDDFSVPEMAGSESLIEWGQNIIEGEASRLKIGGVPLYNPAIAKVKVYYDIFKEFRDNQLLLQQNTGRYSDKVNDLRQPVDELIVDLWNQIEGYFNEQPPYSRIESCKQYGVIYYYRKGEALLTPADDLPKPIVEEDAPVEIAKAETIDMEIPAAVEIVDEEIVPLIQMAEEPVMETQDVPVGNQDIPFEIVLETVDDYEMPVVDEVIAEIRQEIVGTTLFAEETENMLFDIPQEECVQQEEEESVELTMKEVMPSKKRKKRSVKQDELLSLFFQ